MPSGPAITCECGKCRKCRGREKTRRWRAAKEALRLGKLAALQRTRDPRFAELDRLIEKKGKP
jgi:hypothetical protein